MTNAQEKRVNRIAERKGFRLEKVGHGKGHGRFYIMNLTKGGRMRSGVLRAELEVLRYAVSNVRGSEDAALLGGFRYWEVSMIRFATIIALLLFEVSSSFAASPPKLDVRATCRRSQPLTGGDEQTAYQGCLRDETDAQKELVKTWSTFKSSAQAICVQETQIGGAPSYVEVLTCLQLDKQASEAAIENEKSLQMPSAQSGTSRNPPLPKK
jgi:hypothetical protein